MVPTSPRGLLLVALVVQGVAGALGDSRSQHQGFADTRDKRETKDNVYDKRIISDEDDPDMSYNQVKETLRRMFAEGVLVQPTQDDFKDYLDPDILVEEKGSESRSLSKGLESFPTRRRHLFEPTRTRNEPVGGRRGAKRNNGNNGRHGHSGTEHTPAYLNEWAVHMTGGEELAREVAKDLGYLYLGQVGGLQDVYRLRHLTHPGTSKRDAPTITHHLATHAQVMWAEQQYVKERSKRGLLPEADDPDAPLKRIKRDLRLEKELEEVEAIMKARAKLEVTADTRTGRSAMAANAMQTEKMFNDELWDHEWYLFDTRTRDDLPELDLRVMGAWRAGMTGEGVRVLVLDDGMEWQHADLKRSYDPEISYDLNDDDDDPTPRYDQYYTNSHGTRCAGEIAMAPNNRKCGVGVAYGAKVGGVRMLDGPVSDALEGAALGWALDKVDVITSSWGPIDDGSRVEGPGKLASMAIAKGIKEGRGGKGAIYVWAAGNGGADGDNCNCDGYTSSIHTLSISSASEAGAFPWYGERCASTLASAYSSGAYTDQKIVTTDLNNGCTVKFSGTSAAAPLAAGIVALALQANPDMTWRDMQHAVALTSEYEPLAHNGGWQTNARGIRFNPRFGFGLLNAEGMVHAAANWTLVSPQRSCTFIHPDSSGRVLRSGESVELEFEGAGCEDTTDEVRSLEHVEVITSLTYTQRGALTITLTSPMGTTTSLLTARSGDDSAKGFDRWSFMSVHTWGEDPRGTWTVRVADTNATGTDHGAMGQVRLVLHGTLDVPQHLWENRVYSRPIEQAGDQDGGEGQPGYATDHLRSLSWEQLVALLKHRTKSTFSDADVDMLLDQNRLEHVVRNIQSHDESPYDVVHDHDWLDIIKELKVRK